jgi:hypothetical protein
MPLRDCYCVDCDNERMSGLRNRPPRRTEITINLGPAARGDRDRVVHPTCNRCGRDTARCSCTPCPGCGEVGRTHLCQQGMCENYTCNGTCRCALRHVLNYTYCPPVVHYRSTDEYGAPIVQSLEVRFSDLDNRGKYPTAPDSAPYLGLELECELPRTLDRDDIARIWADSGLGWGTSDGSLAHGVECKTYPSTYSFLAQSGLESTLADLVSAGARSWGHQSTGLHTHVSRKSFRSRSHEYVFTWLQVHRFRDQCLALAGRPSGGYSPWPVKDLPKRTGRAAQPPRPPRPERPVTRSDLSDGESTSYDMYVEAQPGTGRNFERGTGHSHEFLMEHFWTERSRRYLREVERGRPSVPGRTGSPLMVIAKKESPQGRGAVAVTGATLELRYWKGTLCGSSVVGQCAFIDALHRYSGTLKLNVKTKADVTWDAFGEWCLENLSERQNVHVARLCANRGVGFHTLQPKDAETPSLA